MRPVSRPSRQSALRAGRGVLGAGRINRNGNDVDNRREATAVVHAMK
jgi:hypothetical protein